MFGPFGTCLPRRSTLLFQSLGNRCARASRVPGRDRRVRQVHRVWPIRRHATLRTSTSHLSFLLSSLLAEHVHLSHLLPDLMSLGFAHSLSRNPLPATGSAAILLSGMTIVL